MPSDVAISASPAISTLDPTDTIYVNNDPGSSHAISQITLTNFLTVAQNGVEKIANKGAHNGYAPLDSSGLVPSANLPALASGVSAINTSLTGNVTNVQLTTVKGLANGYAGLDGTGKVPTSQLPGSVQTASRANNASVSSVIDFSSEQNVIDLNQAVTTATFANMTPGAKTSVSIVQDNTGFRDFNFPATGFQWDAVTGVINPYPNTRTTVGLEVLEDGATVVGYGTALDSSEMWRVFAGQDTFGRDLLATGNAGNNLASGFLYWTFFKARKTATINNFVVWVNVASTGAPTHQFLCLATVDINTWAPTIVALTTDVTDGSLFGSASTAGTKVTKAIPGGYHVQAGRWYAFGCSSIGHTNSPGLASCRPVATMNVYAEPPQMAGVTPVAGYPTVGSSYSWTTGPTVTVWDTLFYAQLT